MLPADYYPVTISINETPEIRDVVQRCARRFELLNHHPVHIITSSAVARNERASKLEHPALLKTLIWDFVPDWVDTILYYDRNVLPARPIEYSPEHEFAAVSDYDEACESARKKWPLFTETGFYFHPGVFIAHRETWEYFEQAYSMRGLDHQVLLNLVMQTQAIVSRLGKKWNFGISVEDEHTEEPAMVNFRGMPRPWPAMRFLLDRLGN